MERVVIVVFKVEDSYKAVVVFGVNKDLFVYREEKELAVDTLKQHIVSTTGYAMDEIKWEVLQ